jgi:hypothetical protein
LHSLPWQSFLIKETETEMLDQKQLDELKERVTAAVGLSKLQALSNTQAQMCEVMLAKRLKKMDYQIDQIQDPEFVGIYEMVTEELLPLG